MLRTPPSSSPAPSSTQRRATIIGLWLLVLDLTLFVPSFAFSAPHADFWPLLSSSKGNAAYRALLALTLRRANLDIFRISFDFGLLLVLAVWSAGGRWARSVCAVCVALYLLLWLFLFYHHAVAYFYWRAPALGEDWRLTLNLVHFVGAMISWTALFYLVGGVLMLIAVGVACSNALRRLQLLAAGWSRRGKLVFAIVWLVPALSSLCWFGVQRDDPVIQLLGKRMLYNWRSSLAEARRMAPLRTGQPDRRYAELAKVSLQRKPDFYLFMVEAYGEILATWDMRHAYHALLARVQQRLEHAGFHARSAYSAAPVHGGTSWFSIATVQSGIRIDRPLPYSALELNGARLPSIAGFFNAQGYRSYALQPGTRAQSGIRRLDLFNHQVMIDAESIGYCGPHFGWGHIPDQYSLGMLRERYLATAPEPRYVFYMGVSTHYPWGDDVPPYVRSWKALDAMQVERADVAADWPGLPGKSEIGSELRQSYFQSVEYEWRLFTELLEAEPSRDIVIVIVGDHQPRLESNPPGGVTMNTPIHVLSRDAAFVDSFAALGFQPGLYADPTLHPPLKHEALFSLLVSKLAAKYGQPNSRHVPYYPDGIGLTGLNP